MGCLLKTEYEAGILGDPQSDSARVKDLSRRPEDMTVIYTDRSVMTVSHIPQTMRRFCQRSAREIMIVLASESVASWHKSKTNP